MQRPGEHIERGRVPSQWKNRRHLDELRLREVLYLVVLRVGGGNDVLGLQTMSFVQDVRIRAASY